MEDDDRTTHWYDNEYDIVYFENYEVKYKEDKEERVSKLPDEWISRNQEEMLKVYYDMKDMGQMEGILEDLEFPQMCEYLMYVKENEGYDLYDWENVKEEEVLSLSREARTFKEYVGQKWKQMMSVKKYMENMYKFKWGVYMQFFEFCYMNA